MKAVSWEFRKASQTALELGLGGQRGFPNGQRFADEMNREVGRNRGRNVQSGGWVKALRDTKYFIVAKVYVC